MLAVELEKAHRGTIIVLGTDGRLREVSRQSGMECICE